MKITTYNQLHEKKISSEAQALLESIQDLLIHKYSNTSEGLDVSCLLIRSDFERVYKATDGDLLGKTFLDLGCGSTSYNMNVGYDNYINKTSKYEYDKRIFEPWLCRALHELGAQVIGIDIGDLNNEEFEHYSLDLLVENALAYIPDHSVDYAHSKLLYSSPQLAKIVRLHNYPQIVEEVKDKNHPYWTRGDQERLAERVLKQQLLPQIERVLKPEGIYFCFEYGR